MLTNGEEQYLNLLSDVRENGERRDDRTGVGTLSVFGRQCRYPINPFPALTTKKLFFRGVKTELLWMLRGEVNIRPLQEKGVHIWDSWAQEGGSLGPVYGAQWRAWDGGDDGFHDQIRNLVKSIQYDPQSRRHILSAWAVHELDKMQLAPCHILAQFYVRGKRYLDCQLYQRSADLFLGAPFNIAQYALLTSMLAKTTGHEPGELIHTIGDAHIYQNHIDQVDEQLTRKPYEPPQLWLSPHVLDIDGFTADDIDLLYYNHHPKIAAPIAV